MKKTKYGIANIPKEIQKFESYHDVADRLVKYYEEHNKKKLYKDTYDSTLRFLYVFPDGSLCTLEAENYRSMTNKTPKWKYAKNLKDTDSNVINRLDRYNIVNSADKILEEQNPYAYELAKKECIPAILFLFYPQLEQLKKAGYKIADTIIYKLKTSFGPDTDWRKKASQTDVKNISNIFHKGTSLYDIIAIPRNLAKEMKDITDIGLWNTCRKLVKKELLDTESIRFLKEANYAEKDIQKIYSIITKGTDGKTYFTVPSLMRYLRKINMYEAIEASEGLILLDDYIKCCHALEVKPRLDSDSLKREHDVMARNARTKIEENRKKRMTERMKPACQKLHKYDYNEDIFFVRGINSFDDLLDEATQQCNCVACYANSIANGASKIFVMREKAHPEKSLITIELGPNNEVRQKCMSHNRPIHNKAHSEFIDRWIKHVQATAKLA